MWEPKPETGKDGDASEAILILYVSDIPSTLGYPIDVQPTLPVQGPPQLGPPIQGIWDNVLKSRPWPCYDGGGGLKHGKQNLVVAIIRATPDTNQEPWLWKCESPKKSVQLPSQETSKTM